MISHDSLKDKTASLTWARCFDVHRLEAAIQRWRVYDVRVEVAVRLAVDKEGHDDGDDQAHDDGNDDAHVQRHVVGAWGRWGEQRPVQRFLHTTEVFPEEASDLIHVWPLERHLRRPIRHTWQQVLFDVEPPACVIWSFVWTEEKRAAQQSFHKMRMAAAVTL